MKPLVLSAIFWCQYSLLALAATPFDEANKGLQGLLDPFATFMRNILFLVAALAFVGVLRYMFKGEKEAGFRLIWWFVGLTFGAVVFAVFTAKGAS